MSRIDAWLRAARPLAHGNIAPPLLVGQAWAYATTGAFSWGTFALVQLFGVVDHLFIVFANDVADREADQHNETFNLFSGGSRVLVEGQLSPAALRRAAVAMAGALLVLGAVWPERPLMPVFALAALGLLHGYSFPPLRLSYRGGGEWLQALGLGAVLPLVGFYGQAGSFDSMPWTGLGPLILVGLAGNILTALPDEPADRAADKRTWPVVRGAPAARRAVLVLLAAAIVVAPLVGPPLSAPRRAALVLVPTVPWLASLRFAPQAEAKHHRACFWFVFLAAGSGAALWLTWVVVAFL